MYDQKGNVNNKEQMLKDYSGTVKKIAFQIKSRLPASVEMDDLIQAGMIGLMDAINRYEDTHGAQFETYASQRIKGSILDELRSADFLPRSLRKNMRDIEVAVNKLEQAFGRSPSESMIAREMNISIEDYQDILGSCNGHQLIYYEDFHDPEAGSEHFLDRHATGTATDPVQLLLSSDFRQSLIDSIDLLPEREKSLMSLYYEQEMNFKEIGAVLDISESRVCQLHTQAVARLRATMKEKLWTGIA